MAENIVLKNLIHHDNDELDREIVNSLADKIVPQLRTLIQTEARAIAQRYELRSPFVEDAAMRLLISELVGFLALTDLDSTEDCCAPSWLTAKHVRYWLSSGD